MINGCALAVLSECVYSSISIDIRYIRIDMQYVITQNNYVFK